MNILEDFKPFLKNWCHENHLPMPEEGKMNRVWQSAWQSYMETHLTDHYEEIKQSYLDMEVLTVGQLKKLEAEQNSKTIELDTKEDSKTAWQRIQEMMVD